VTLEQVVLLDATGRAIGKSAKSDAHHASTPLHLAFSVFVLNHAGQVLLTRRALSKQTWPGVWTNSCCGHPGIGEPVPTAIHRRVREELRIEITHVRTVLPNFAYVATDASGIMENEICPVFVAQTVHPAPPLSAANPEEVMDFAWTEWTAMAAAMAAAPFAFSPWAVRQVALLGGDRSP
jgi:isopentenyl-diphosphate delta-isomerase